MNAARWRRKRRLNRLAMPVAKRSCAWRKRVKQGCTVHWQSHCCKAPESPPDDMVITLGDRFDEDCSMRKWMYILILVQTHLCVMNVVVLAMYTRWRGRYRAEAFLYQRKEMCHVKYMQGVPVRFEVEQGFVRKWHPGNNIKMEQEVAAKENRARQIFPKNQDHRIRRKLKQIASSRRGPSSEDRKRRCYRSFLPMTWGRYQQSSCSQSQSGLG